MLYNEIEVQIMKKAIQPNMRDKKTLVEPYLHIVEDYLYNAPLKNMKILDIGPGQCDFLDIAKASGAMTYGVDFDLAVIELGTLRGHHMKLIESFQKEWPYAPSFFDGIFCRGSLNYLSKTTCPKDSVKFLGRIFSSLKPEGWLWAAPWIKVMEEFPKDQEGFTRNCVKDLLKKFHIRSISPDEKAKNRYSINYIIPISEIWTRNLPSHYRSATSA